MKITPGMILGVCLTFTAGCAGEQVEKKASTAASAPPPVVLKIPAGTALNVSLDEEIGTGHSQVGETFPVTLTHDVRVAGRTVLSAGRRLTGRITELEKGKGFKRLLKGDAVGLRLIALEGNESYPLQTNRIRVEARGAKFISKLKSNIRDGALIGNEIDGTDGAVVGARVAAGTTLLLEGRRVTFNPGQRFRFELAKAFAVTMPAPSQPVVPEAPLAAPETPVFAGVLWALGAHTILAAIGLFMTYRQVRRGVWPPPPRSAPIEIFRLQWLLLHLVGVCVGFWFFDWLWAVGAVVAVTLSHVAYMRLCLVGVFAPQPSSVAPEMEVSIPPPPPPPPPISVSP